MELQIIAELIEDIFETEEFDLKTDFYDDLGADWLDMIELMYGCEEEFEIEIGESAMKEVSTVGELCALVRRLNGAE